MKYVTHSSEIYMWLFWIYISVFATLIEHSQLYFYLLIHININFSLNKNKKNINTKRARKYFKSFISLLTHTAVEHYDFKLHIYARYRASNTIRMACGTRFVYCSFIHITYYHTNWGNEVERRKILFFLKFLAQVIRTNIRWLILVLCTNLLTGGKENLKG